MDPASPERRSGQPDSPSDPGDQGGRGGRTQQGDHERERAHDGNQAHHGYGTEQEKQRGELAQPSDPAVVVEGAVEDIDDVLGERARDGAAVSVHRAHAAA